MGIKHFFYWFKTNFNKNMVSLGKRQNFTTERIQVDNLMIDLNGLFHSSTQKVYQYGDHKPKGRFIRRRRENKTQQRLKVFEDICHNIETLLITVNPKKSLILCVDGPAPISKQNQQRQRRFRSAFEKEPEEFKKFDSNCITPGTQFMDYLTKYIDWYIRQNISTNPMWKRLKVVFSNEKVPGEGEHKIINYIRLYGNLNDSFCIHGLDADLIMLALGTHVSKFWILRDDLYDYKNNYFAIDIGQTRKDLAELLRWGENGVEFDAKTSINDFIFLCFMVGNDFLPHIPSLEIIEGGIDDMIAVYQTVGERHGHLTMERKDDVVFNPTVVEAFFSTISKYDKKILEDKLTKKHKFFRDELLEKHSTPIGRKYELDIEAYRREYYETLFDRKVDQKALCHQYLSGLQWVLSYYTRGVPDWTWCFKHHYAPFAHELATHTSDFKYRRRHTTQAATPFQQLLSVLPPQSHALLPHPLSSLFTNPNSGILKYCPEKLEVDLSGKRQEWEGIVLLPLINFNVVKSEYFKQIAGVSPRDLRLNKVGKSHIYEYSHRAHNFRSYYGDIPMCKVKTREIKI